MQDVEKGGVGICVLKRRESHLDTQHIFLLIKFGGLSKGNRGLNLKDPPLDLPLHKHHMYYKLHRGVAKRCMEVRTPLGW